MLNNRKPNKHGQQHETAPALKRVRKSVYKQALLTGFLIVLTVVILFAVTAAWYTNIAQTNDLVFKASSWGFAGQVKSVDAAIIASPGDEGVVELTAKSESDDITAISLNVSRAQMPAEIQKRIFFYVDTSKTSSGETMERIYLGNDNSYTYMLFGRETLMLTETVHNDALIKWHWVYDVLGYYVLGTWDEINMDMTVSEYLRPIEYKYDEALTEFDAAGNLLTVDGTTTVSQLLEQISAHDGYAGTIDPSKKNSGGYYPVSVDESTGYGVWAYLCDYSEIQVNTAYDTYLGENADAEGELAAYVAKLTLSAQNSYLEPTQIDTPAALVSAIRSGETSVIRLNSDMALSEALVIGTELGTQQVMLDLNGKTLTLDSGDAAGIQVAPGSALTVTNGALAGSGDGYAIDGAGAEITLSGVTVTDVDRAIYVRDNEAENTLHADAKIRVVGCNFTTSDVSILISGNGSDSAQATQLVVEDSVIRSDYIGIAFNGSTNQWGTSTQIINSDVYGKWAGIYHPQSDADLVISNGSVISGYTGLVLKGGSTTLIDSTVHGTGEAKEPESLPASGFNDTGDAIYIETNYGGEILLEISGNSTVISDHALALRIYEDTSNAKVTIYSGCFSTGVEAYCAANTQHTKADDGNYCVSAVAEQAAYAAMEEENENTVQDDTELQGGSAWTEDEITQTEETQTEETSAEETPAEETPAEETPAEETPAEETPAEETPAEETPAEETPAEETQT